MIVTKLVVAAGLIHVQATTTNIDIPHDSVVRALAIADQCEDARVYSDVVGVVALSVGLNLAAPSASDAQLLEATRAQYKALNKSGKKLACKLVTRVLRTAAKEISK